MYFGKGFQQGRVALRGVRVKVNIEPVHLGCQCVYGRGRVGGHVVVEV